MIYSELVKSADAIMDGELRLPTTDFEDKILTEPWTPADKAVRIYDYRCWQLATMGFQRVSVAKMIEIMYGQKHTKQWFSKEKHKYDCVFNHHRGERDKRCWVYSLEYFSRDEESVFWHWPPWDWKEVWRCKLVALNEINEVPDALILKVLRLQALNLFNVLHVIVPSKTSSNLPVLLGTIWELPPNNLNDKVGYVTHFFLSEWC